jgi:micrococcal nuclease
MKYFIVVLLFVSNSVFGQLTGKVVSVADGDTLTLLTSDQHQTRIRLHGIDCPERKQDFGAKAKQFLADLVFAKEVYVKGMDIDRYGRTIGIVIVEGVNVNEALLRAGIALQKI